MARKNDTPQKAAMREMMSSYLKQHDVKIKDRTDVNAIMRDMMSIILEGVLDEELNENLGYSKYDYRNKETDNARNGLPAGRNQTADVRFEKSIRSTNRRDCIDSTGCFR